jgi:hypothetical protein
MAKETTTTTVEKPDPPKATPPPVDPDVQIAKLRFWARLLISMLAFFLFGFLVIKMVDKPDELTASSRDLINLALGSFLPLLGMLGKHWFESDHEQIVKPKNDDGPKTFEQKVELKAGE